MPNSFDTDGRGPSNGRLFLAGICSVLAAAVVAALMVAKSKGQLDDTVPIRVELTNVGDGLPANSDVKFRGALVGSVSDLVPASIGHPNTVHIRLNPDYASAIPDTVTARVVPSNVFAVSSLQLVDNGNGSAPLHAGAVIHEDQTLPTVLFQTTLSKFRQVFAAVGREPRANSVGVLDALGQATNGRGNQLGEAAGDLNEIVAQLNTLVNADNGPSTIAALNDATAGLRSSAPELFDALGRATKPMRTLAEKRSALTNFLSAGLTTSTTLAAAFDHQTDRLIAITTELTPMVGVLADNAGQFHPIFTRMQRLGDQFNDIWDPDKHMFTIYAIASFTPTRTYVRQDCPRYGELAGPSCQTAPEVPTAPALLPALASRGYPPTPGLPENRANLAPPRRSLPPPSAVVPTPDTPATGSTDTPQTPADPGAGFPSESSPPAQPTSPPGAQTQSAEIGNIGPVGSPHEYQQLSQIVGGEANAGTELLLGPLARGATVHLALEPGGGR